MSQHKFIDRKEELEMLGYDHSRNDSSLFIIYGRRRVGKTELINQFIGKNGIYFLSTDEGDIQNIKDFQKVISNFLNDDSINNGVYNDFYSFLSMLANNVSFKDYVSRKKLIIAIDEFPYLIEGNRSIPSVFQKIYDLLLKNMNVMLILSGSFITMMENNVLSYKSPLYGRRSGQIKLKPIKFRYIKEFINYNFTDLCKIYFILGGIPEYLLKMDNKLTFDENILHNIINKSSTLYNEAEFLLRTELRETRNYMLILRSIAGGYRTVGEINSYTNMDKSMVSKYIDILLSLELISYEIPFGETEKFRKRLYYINDNYLKFWFRYILPNRTGIENSNYLEVARKIENDFSQFAGEQFEYLMRELIMDGILGRTFTTVSRWWGKVGNNTGKNIEEIDIVAYSDTRDEILFCECKWTNKKVSYKIIEELIRKSKWLLNKYNNSKVSYAVFSKSGFDFNTDTLEKDIIAMDLKGIENALYK